MMTHYSPARRMSGTILPLFQQLWPLCGAIFVTVASSMAVAAWFNRVPSRSHPHLPQVLFYTRVLADLLAPPATLWLPSTAVSEHDDDDTTIDTLLDLERHTATQLTAAQYEALRAQTRTVGAPRPVPVGSPP